MIRASQESRNIFVGRSEECDGFAATLKELTTDRPSGFLGLRRGSASRTHPRVFLIQGSGGVGKTTLVRRFAQLAVPDGVRWSLCNWENARDAGTLPADLPGLLSHLHNAVVAQLGDEAAPAFQGFRDLLNKHAETKSKAAKVAAEARPKYDAVVSAAATAASSIVSELALPGTRAIVAELAKSGIEIAGSGAAAVVQALAARLSDEEYTLFANPADRHASEFVDALVQLGRETPFVLAQDTCDLTERDNLQGEFRSMIVRPTVDRSSEVVFVLAGRTEMGRSYSKIFEDSPRILQDSVLERFTESEVGDFLAAASLSRDLAPEVLGDTLGLPSVVAIAVSARSNASGENVMNRSDIAVQLVERILSEVIESSVDSPDRIRQKAIDRYRLYSLALIEGQDPEALRACWSTQAGAEMTTADVRVALAALRRANAFIFEDKSDRLLEVFREGTRRYITERQARKDGWLDGPAIRELHQTAADSFETRLKSREDELADRNERLDDAEWKRLKSAALRHRFWLDADAAFREFCCLLIESIRIDTTWVNGLLAAAGETPIRELSLFETVSAGIQDWEAKSGTDLPLLAMWDLFIELAPKWGLSPEFSARLAMHRAATLLRLERLDESAAEAEIGLKALPPDAPKILKKGLVSLIVISAGKRLEASRYAEAATLAKRAIAYDPDNVELLSFVVSALSSQKEFVAAHQLVDEFAASHPDSPVTHQVRSGLLWMEGRNVEAQLEFNTLVQSYPAAAAEYMTQMVKAIRDPEVMKVVDQLGRAAGLEDDSLSLDTQKKMFASPEAAAEIIEATMRIGSAPTIDDILALRKLTVDRFPDLAAARLDYGATLLAASRTEEALAEFKKGRELSKSPMASLQPAELLIMRGLYAEALPLCEEAAERFPTLPGARSSLIKCLIQLGKAEAALAAGKKALEDFPDDYVLKFQVGSLLLEHGDPAQGWQLAREGYIGAPDLIRGQMTFNLYAISGANPAGFHDLVDRMIPGWPPEAREGLLSLQPERLVPATVELCLAGVGGKSLEKPSLPPLIQVWETILEARPNELVIRRTLAGLCAEAGQFERAAEILEVGLTANLTAALTSDLHFELAKLYNTLNRPADHLRHLRQATDLLSTEGLRYLAVLMLDAGELEAALATYETSLAAEPDPDYDNRLRFAQAYMGSRRFARSLEILDLLLKEQPDNTDVITFAATALFYTGKFQESAAMAAKGCEVSLGDPIMAALAARALLATGDSAGAEDYRRRATLLLAATMTYNQACVLAILGKSEEALEKLARAVAEDPSVVTLARTDADLLELRGTPAFETALRPPSGL